MPTPLQEKEKRKEDEMVGGIAVVEPLTLTPPSGHWRTRDRCSEGYVWRPAGLHFPERDVGDLGTCVFKKKYDVLFFLCRVKSFKYHLKCLYHTSSIRYQHRQNEVDFIYGNLVNNFHQCLHFTAIKARDTC